MKLSSRRLLAPVFLTCLSFSQAVSPCLASAAAGQGTARTRPAGYGLPLRPQREISFTTTEGTWMSVDIHPDGRTLIFDHLGDIYTLPIEGGTARRLLGGMEMDTQPRFSPDGRHIAFISDRSGRSEVWAMAADGTGLRQLSPDQSLSVYDYRDPVWTPDGSAVVAMLAATGLGGTYITGFPFPGGGAPVPLATPDPSGGMKVFVNSSFSPDGNFLYLAASNSAGTDVLGGATQRSGRYGLARLDTRTREVADFLPREGGSFAPLVTRSGRSLIYATRDLTRSETVLRRYDFATRQDRILTRPVQLDLQESAMPDTLPAYDVTDDERTLVIAHSGKLWRVDMESGRQTEIPFRVDVRLHLGPIAHFDYPLDDSQRQIRWPWAPTLSPDGRTLAFGSVGAIWLASTVDGELRRLTPSGHRAESAAWSPDGRWVAYTTWDPAAGQAALWRIPADGRGSPRRIAQRRGPYEEPLFAPDGRGVFVRAPTWPRTASYYQRTNLVEPNVSVHYNDLLYIGFNGSQRSVARIAGDWGAHSTTMVDSFLTYGGLHYSGADRRLYFRENYNLQSIRPDGSDRRTDSPAPGDDAPSELVLSPQGDRVLRAKAPQEDLTGVTFEEVTRGGDGRLVFANAREIRGLDHLQWSADGRYFWGFEDMRFVRYDRAAFERDPEGYRPYELELNLRVPTERPSGSIVLRGARIITMRGHEAIERGDVVVTGNRIVAVGPSGSVEVPDGAQVVDASGKTILPGWIDIHSHSSNGFYELARAWRMAAVAYGVTTLRDPSPNAWPVTAWDDIAAGLDIGPRAFSTGPALRNLSNASDGYLETIVRRFAEGLRTETLKEYRSGGRGIRQRILSLAHRYRLTPTHETYESFWANLSQVIDGYHGLEHSPGVTPYYDDVIQLLARSGTVWTPTLATAGPDRYPDEYANYLLLNHDLNRDERYQRFIPREWQNHPRDIYRVRTYDRYLTPRSAADAARIIAAGGRIALGSHGDVPGMGVHLELWAMASGGMPLHDVLRVGTIFGAEAIGHGADFGSIEPGKLADLQVLDRNPLEDIRNSVSTSMVMTNGFLYDARTLDQVWPERRPLPRQWWQEDRE